MSHLAGTRQARLTKAIQRGKAMAEDAMRETCSVEENQIDGGGDHWVTVASNVPCRITTPGGIGQPLALTESPVLEHVGIWHVHVPIGQAIQIGARILCQSIIYSIIGEKTQRTYPVERVLIAATLHTPGTALP